jgi:hypothetical protein
VFYVCIVTFLNTTKGCGDLGSIYFPFKDEYKDEPKLAIYPKTLFGTIYAFLFTYENLVMATFITFGALCVTSMLQILHHLDYSPPPQ